MTRYCNGADQTRDIASLIESADCDVTLFIERAYHGLFGGSGSMAPVLVGALTIYVALYGYRLMAGRGVSGADLTRRFVLLGFVLAFSSNLPAYQTVFVNAVTEGAEEIARMISLAASDRAVSSYSIASGIDQAIAQMIDAADHWSRRTPLDTGGLNSGAPLPAASNSPAGATAPNMLWASAVLFGVSSAGVIVVVKAALALMLALGPLFLTLGVFPETRGLMEGWLRLVVSGALVLALSLLSTAGALELILPAIGYIAADQAVGVNDSESVLALLMVCIVFAMLMRQIISSVSQLAAAWRLPDGRPSAESAERNISPPNTQPPASVSDPRITEIVAAATRDISIRPARADLLPQHAAISAGGVAADGAGDMRRAPRAYRGFGSSNGSLSTRPA